MIESERVLPVSQHKRSVAEASSSWFRRLAVVSLLASVAACGLTGCDDDSSSDNTTTACDGKSCKAAGTCTDVSGTCTCNNGGDISKDCVVATDACNGKACKTAGTCKDESGTCTCNNGGDISKDCVLDTCSGKACKIAGTCTEVTGTCTCNNGGDISKDCVLATDACDGKACKIAGTCKDESGTCTCNNGGDISKDCVVATDACDGKSCKAAGTCSDVGGICTCNNGGDIANTCVVATDACDGKSCKAAGTCSDVDGTCTCNNGEDIARDCEGKCGKLPDYATQCLCDEDSGQWKEDTCTYQCPENGKDNDKNCDCGKNGWYNCNYCNDKPSPSLWGQFCDPATGEYVYDPSPALVVSVDKTSIREGGSANITVKLNVQPSSDVKVVMSFDGALSPYMKTKDSCRANKCWKDIGTLNGENWNTGITYTFETNDIDKKANDNLTFDLIHTASASDAKDFNELSDQKTITIVDDDKPGIIFNCENNVVEMDWSNTQGYDCAWYPSRDEKISHSQFCTVSLSKAPTSDVVVTLIPDSDEGKFLNPSVHINDVFIDDVANYKLTFTPENYNVDQMFKLSFNRGRMDLTDFDRINLCKYTVNVKSDTSGYEVSEITKDFKVRPWPKFMVFTRLCPSYECYDQVKHSVLRAGKYRLHAWGASGGLATDANMAIDSDKGFQCKNHGGAGAYIHADLNLVEPTDIYIYIGVAGTSSSDGETKSAYNGGGKGKGGSASGTAVGGGGATDFCIGNTDCEKIDTHWPYRILVAGGGGGSVNPDTCESNGEVYATGGSATWQGDGGYGMFKGQKTDSTDHVYAFGGSASQDSNCSDSESLFGKGQNANADAVGGNGGGWYGGHYGPAMADIPSDVTKNVGGGAGSSYAFTGDNGGCGGRQNAMYALTNVGGRNGLSEEWMDGESNYFPSFTSHPFAECFEYGPCGSLLNKKYKDVVHVGNIGDGYAVIETLYDEE